MRMVPTVAVEGDSVKILRDPAFSFKAGSVKRATVIAAEIRGAIADAYMVGATGHKDQS